MKKYKMCEMPTKKDLRTYLNERLFEGAKVKRISSYHKHGAIFQVKMDIGKMYFVPSCCNVQSIQTFKGNMSICYTISNDIYGFGSIISEIEHWRRNPEAAKERGYTVI